MKKLQSTRDRKGKYKRKIYQPLYFLGENTVQKPCTAYTYKEKITLGTEKGSTYLLVVSVTCQRLCLSV